MQITHSEVEFGENDIPIEHVLKNRGISDPDIRENYIQNTLDEYENSFDLLDNIDEGIECLEKHIEAGSKICIIVDSDVDGYTSSAITALYLHERYPKLEKIDYIMHDGKEHGIILDKVPDDCDLLIVPDAGSNDYEQHKFLKDRGTDVIVLDHHEADGGVSKDAIIINNQLSDYPNKSLCGAAIAYKFAQGIDDKYGNNLADNYLDLVSLGLISDMMDMRQPETFNLIQQGMRKAVKNPFFQFLLDKQSYSIGDEITPMAIAFYVTPLINAAIRVATNEQKEVVFQAFVDPHTTSPSTKRGAKPGDLETKMEQAGRFTTNARSKQNKLRDKGLESIEGTIGEGGLLDNKVLLIEVQKGELEKTITGLVANQLMSKYQRPVLVLRSDGQVLRGSGRSYDKSNLDNFRGYLSDTGFFNYAQGHNSAFGASIDKSKVPEFIEHVNKDLEDFNFEVTHKADFAFESLEDSDILKSSLANLNKYSKYWGKSIEEPMIHLTNIRVDSSTASLIGKGKNTLKIQSGEVVIIKFRLNDEEQERFDNIINGGKVATIDVIGKPNKNEWGGRVTQQLFVVDYEITDETVVF